MYALALMLVALLFRVVRKEQSFASEGLVRLLCGGAGLVVWCLNEGVEGEV